MFWSLPRKCKNRRGVCPCVCPTTVENSYPSLTDVIQFGGVLDPLCQLLVGTFKFQPSDNPHKSPGQQSAIKAYARKIFLDRLITEMFIFVYLLSVFRLETVKNPSHTLCAGVQYLHPHYFWLYDELQANYVGIFELSIWASVINRLATGK